MTKVWLLGENTEIDTDRQYVQVGQIVQMNGYDYDRYAVAEVLYNAAGYNYRLINLRTHEYCTTEIIRPLSAKFGIGYYYDDQTPQMLPEAELAHLRQLADKQEEARQRQVQQKEEERERRRVVGAERLRQAYPAGAVAVIVAHLQEDESEPMTDYFGARTVRSVILGFSDKTRENFAELRRAAAHFPDTAYLAEYDCKYEHRERYSGGHGFYLGDSYYSGWIVRKELFRDLASLIQRYADVAGSHDGFCLAPTPGHGTTTDIPLHDARIQITDYSEKAIAVFGDTKPLKEILRSLGGRFSPRLTYLGTPTAGWVFPKRNEQKVREALAPHIAA